MRLDNEEEIGEEIRREVKEAENRTRKETEEADRAEVEVAVDEQKNKMREILRRKQGKK